MQRRNWLLRAIWWSCSGERILQVRRNPGLENQERRGSGARSSRPGSGT